MENSSEKRKIVVVGGGLVGSMLSCMLAQKGYDIGLYEAREDIRKSALSEGKSINLALSVRGREALKRIGLEESVIEHGIPMKGRMIHTLDGQTNEIPYDPVKNQCIYSVSRKFLNEILLSEVEKHPNAKLFFKHKFVRVDLNSDTLTFHRTDVQKDLEVKGKPIIIGADGAFSGVRKHLMTQPMFNYSQTYIEHGYMELCIPPSEDNNFQMPENFLHIWPRGTFMMIALPNQDFSWTVTLFMPFEFFNLLHTPQSLLDFFQKYFPDSISLIGEEKLVADFFSRKASPLISIKCNPYHKNDNILIVGDAAHAMVPFYGQGMNAGFEDCCVLDDLIIQFDKDFSKILPKFTEVRQKDAEAICDLAMYNYIEMRDLVTKKSFLWRKKIDNFLFQIIPDWWIPLYNAVTFTRINYAKCIKHKQFQDTIINTIILVAGCILVFVILVVCLLS